MPRAVLWLLVFRVVIPTNLDPNNLAYVPSPDRYVDQDFDEDEVEAPGEAVWFVSTYFTNSYGPVADSVYHISVDGRVAVLLPVANTRARKLIMVPFILDTGSPYVFLGKRARMELRLGPGINNIVIDGTEVETHPAQRHHLGTNLLGWEYLKAKCVVIDYGGYVSIAPKGDTSSFFQFEPQVTMERNLDVAAQPHAYQRPPSDQLAAAVAPDLGACAGAPPPIEASIVFGQMDASKFLKLLLSKVVQKKRPAYGGQILRQLDYDVSDAEVFDYFTWVQSGFEEDEPIVVAGPPAGFTMTLRKGNKKNVLQLIGAGTKGAVFQQMSDGKLEKKFGASSPLTDAMIEFRKTGGQP